MKQIEAQKKVIKSIVKTDEETKFIYTLFYRHSKKVASFGMPLYSITVEMISDGKHTEHTISEVFADVGKASVFFNMLADNLATPHDLPYILEDSINI